MGNYKIKPLFSKFTKHKFLSIVPLNYELTVPLFLTINNCVHLLLHKVDHFIKSSDSEKHIITTERGRRSSVVKHQVTVLRIRVQVFLWVTRTSH